MAKSISVGFISAVPNFYNLIIFIFFFLLSPPSPNSTPTTTLLKQLFPLVPDAKVIDLISQSHDKLPIRGLPIILPPAQQLTVAVLGWVSWKKFTDHN